MAGLGRAACVSILLVVAAWEPGQGPAEDRSALQPGTTRVNPHDGLEYSWVTPGSFWMGCVPEDEWCYDQERPRHQVSLGTGFWIGRTEVTAQAFERFAKGVGWSVPAAAGPSYPVTGIDWESARSFCAAAGGRLPTEAEWEMAARGGRDSLVYPGGNELTHEQANFLGVAGRDTWKELAPVASFPATGFGLYDMAGNAWEWVADWMDEEYYGRSPKVDPGGPSAGERRVVRGGSAENKPSHLRVSLRLADLPESGNAFKGFRCVLAAIPD